MRANFVVLLHTLLLLSLWPTSSLQFVYRADNSQSQVLDSAGHNNTDISSGGNPTKPAGPIEINLFEIPLQTLGGAWVGSIKIGGKTFKVNFDTGSAAIVVPKAGSANSGTLNQYSPGSKKSLNDDVTIRYGSGTATGSLYVDTVTTVPSGANTVNFRFVAAQTFPAVWVANGIDGVLGMSDGVDSPELPLYFQSFFDAFPSGIDRKFTFLPGTDGKVTLTVGGDYVGQLFPTINSLNVIQNYPDPETPRWTVQLQSIRFQDDDANTNYAQNGLAILDTGNALIQAPASVVEPILNKLGGSSLSPQGIHDVPCSALPNLLITFVQDPNRAFSVPAVNLLAPEGSDCRVLIGTRDGPGDHWTLGTPFLKTVYSQFNLGQTGITKGYTIGLAPLP